jgi:hypothetical protein
VFLPQLTVYHTLPEIEVANLQDSAMIPSATLLHVVTTKITMTSSLGHKIHCCLHFVSDCGSLDLEEASYHVVKTL